MPIFAAIAGISLLIIFHELGHWFVAQSLGFRTPVFCVGFGAPYVVIGVMRNTEFRITPWLLGGYVEVPELWGEEAEIKQFEIWKRAAVSSAGVIMNVLVALALFFIVFANQGLSPAEAATKSMSSVASASTSIVQGLAMVYR
ncbi:hypothetical protein BH10CYA1_BH10CYA1_48440 [soil metagenome]